MFANADSRNQDSDAPQPILLNYAYNQPGSMPGTMAIAAQAQSTEIVLIDYNTIQIIDPLEIYRELASGLMDVYLSVVSNKMNEVMKLLAVISTVFIPLTFVAGVYGMNFNPQTSPWNMPELNWYWGYPLCLAIILVITLGLIAYFWRLGWLKPSAK